LKYKKHKTIHSAPEKVVVIQPGFVGDVVFTSPLVHAIKQVYPGTGMALMVRPERADVASCIPGVDEVLVFDKRGKDSGPLGLLRACRKLRRGGFDLLIAPHRSTRTALLAGLSGISQRVGFDRGLGRFFYKHVVPLKTDEPCRLFQDFDLLKQIGIKATDSRLRMRAPDKEHSYLDSFFQGHHLDKSALLVGLNIGSVWETKRWPAVYFAGLAADLKSRGYFPVLFGGPGEKKLAGRIQARDKTQKSTSNGQCQLLTCVGNSLSEATALLDRCTIVVGGDSGLTHIARALKVPTVIVYGPTDPRLHVFEERTRVLFSNVKCRPCHRHGQRRCPEMHHDCMRMITPEQVMRSMADIIALNTPAPGGSDT
jgi:heptosyltransferase-2